METRGAYRVRFTVTVDRPDKRDASFAPVRPGFATALEERYVRQGAAVRAYDAMLAGEWDFASEYVSRVAVYAEGGRVVRRERRRPRLLVVRLFRGNGRRLVAPSTREGSR